MLGYFLPHPPILVKEIGMGRENICKKTLDSLEMVAKEVYEYKPEVIIVISPHAPIYPSAIFINKSEVLYGDFGNYATHLTFKFSNAIDLVNRIIDLSSHENVPIVDRYITEDIELDHGVLVPLYFLTKYYKNCSLVHTTFAFIDDIKLYKYGLILRKASEELSKKVLIVASGDLSHRLLKVGGTYPYAEEGPIFDEQFVKKLGDNDLLGAFKIDKKIADKAGECGFRSFKVLLGFFDEYEVKTTVYSYEGPFGVGYCVAKFEAENQSASLFDLINRKDIYIRLAKDVVEYYVKNKKIIGTIPHYVDNRMLTQKAGVFVSIKKNGKLRGCIGTILPTEENIAKEIIRNAIMSATQDPRFYPITEDELNDLTYSVDILGQPEKVSTKEELDPKKYGVIVSRGYKKGLLLPDLEGVNTVDEQLMIACQKAGIDYFTEEFEIERFTVERHN